MGRGLMPEGGLSEVSLNPDLKEMRGEGEGHIKRSHSPDPRNNLACSRKSKSNGLQPSERGRENELKMRHVCLHNFQGPV